MAKGTRQGLTWASWLAISSCLLTTLSAKAEPLTRSAGLVGSSAHATYGNSGPHPDGHNPVPPQYHSQGYSQGYSQLSGPHKVRVTLTRNISNVSAGSSMQAPEVSYFGAVGVGSPANMFNVVFDTGASEVWLPSYNWFPFANNLHYSEGYSCKDSSTCVQLDKKFSYDYRFTRMSGGQYEDVFTLYEDLTKEDAPVLPSAQLSFGQNFLAVDEASDEQFRWKPYDAVIGLAPVAQSSSGTRNLLLSLQQERQHRQMQSMASDLVPAPPGPTSSSNLQQYFEQPYQGHSQYNQNQGPLQQQQFLQSELVFAIWINPAQHSRHGGEITLGGIDENRFLGEIYFHRINSWFDWQLPLSYVQLGGQVVSCPGGCNAILDSGVNSLVGPRQDVLAIYQELQAEYNQEADLWLVDCQSIDSFPQLTFRLDETPYALYGRHYVKMFRYRDQVVCHLAIKPWDKPNWLLGTSFIGAYYTIFDFASRRVGFATPR